jgi:hypothetical protein
VDERPHDRRVQQQREDAAGGQPGQPEDGASADGWVVVAPQKHANQKWPLHHDNDFRRIEVEVRREGCREGESDGHAQTRPAKQIE